MQRFYWALVVLSLAAFSMAVTPPADTWWYLAGGREILLQKQMSFPDPFSFTTAGQSWFRQAWLVEIIFYILWVMGGLPGIFALRTLFIVLAFGLVPMVLVKERDDPLPYLCFPLLIWLGQAEMFVDVRAYLFTYLFLSLTLLWARWFMENGQLKWALLGIAVMPIWANCHGGFILGSGVWGIIGLGLLLAKDRRGVKLIGVSLTGYFLAVLNPYGPKMWWFPFSLMGDSIFSRGLNEWAAPNFGSLSSPGPQAPFLLLVPLAVGLLAYRKAALWEWMLACIFLALGLKTWRHGPLAALILAHLLPRHLPKLKPNPNLARAILGLWLIVGIYFFGERARGGPERWGALKSLFPHQAVQFIRENPQLPKRVMNPYEWGGYLAWKLGPTTQTFIDGRAHILYSEQTYADALQVQFGQDWQATFDRYGYDLKARSLKEILDHYEIPMVIATKIQGDLPQRMATLQGWKVIYEDRNSVLYLRDSPSI